MTVGQEDGSHGYAGFASGLIVNAAAWPVKKTRNAWADGPRSTPRAKWDGIDAQSRRPESVFGTG